MSALLSLKGRTAVVLGANSSGVELIRFLVRKGTTPVLVDPGEQAAVESRLQDELDSSKYRLECGDLNSRTFEGAELVIVTAGFPLDLPVLEAARTAGVQVRTELEFVSLYVEAPIVAVAGTKGKSTTAHLLQSFLEAEGRKVFSNVQRPLASLLNLHENFDHVLVVSTSFQLEGVSSYKPKMIVFTNLLEDHLDRYPNIETYMASNREVFKNACAETVNVLNGANVSVQQFAPMLLGRKVFFGGTDLPSSMEGAWGDRQAVHFQIGSATAPLTVNLRNFRLRGPHNRENLMAAGTAALMLGVQPDRLQAVVDNVRTLPGRVEFVRRLNSVSFYDDSCSSNPEAVMKSLQGFNEPVILISGGRDKNLDYSMLAPHIRQRVKNLILVGEAKEKINRFIGDYTETFLVGTIEEAVLLAYQKSRSGDVVLLAPACAPTDVFSDHAAKGEFFKNLVTQLAQPRRPNVL